MLVIGRQIPAFKQDVPMTITRTKTQDRKNALVIEQEDINAYFKQARIQLQVSLGHTLESPQFRLTDDDKLVAVYLSEDFFARFEAFEHNGGMNNLALFNTATKRDAFAQGQIVEGKHCMNVDRYGSMTARFTLAGAAAPDNNPDHVAYGVFTPCPSDQIALADGRISEEALRKKAEVLLDDYSEFTNGESYRINVEVFERDDQGDFMKVEQSSLTGFHGQERAKAGLQAEAGHYQPVPAYQPRQKQCEDSPEL